MSVTDSIFDLGRLADVAERERERYRVAEPFPHAVIEDFLRPEAARAILAQFPGPEDDVSWDRFGAEGFEVKLGSSCEEKFPAVLRHALRQLNSGPFIRFLESLTGIPHLLPDPHMHGGGIHLVGPGGHLGVHADFNWHDGLRAHRRINLMIYLNPDWLEDYGGELELWATDASHRVKSVQPLFNRAVVFNTRSDTFHGHPARLNVPEGVYRRSLAMYYYTSERPENESRAPHSTLYKGFHVP